MTSTALQPAIERPSESFRSAVHTCPRGSSPPLRASVPECLRASPSILLPGNVAVFASRDGDRVTGRVEFPYEVSGRTSVPIDYRNAGPPPSCLRASVPSCLDAKASFRLSLVNKWRDLCAMDRDVPRREHARTVTREAVGIKCSPRSLQLWSMKLETLGPEALADQYAPAPRKVLSLDQKSASDAVSICAWWCFRVGNAEVIDSKMVYSASIARFRAAFCADVFAAIDCYYSWDTNRVRYPFKSFVRWAKYDVETWLGRALDANDYRAKLAEERVPLQGGLTPESVPSGVPDSRARRADVNHRGTLRALRDLALSEGGSPPPVASLPGCLAASSSIHSAIMSPDDRMRIMLFSAARGDAQAKAEAVATMPIWWQVMPESVCNNIDTRVQLWKAGHHGVTDRALRGRKLLMLLDQLRREDRGPESVSVAAGMVL